MAFGFIKRMFKKKEEELPPLNQDEFHADFDVGKPDIGGRFQEEDFGRKSHLGLESGFNVNDKDMQLILTKLELINQRLEVLDRRLQIIEKIAKENQ